MGRGGAKGKAKGKSKSVIYVTSSAITFETNPSISIIAASEKGATSLTSVQCGLRLCVVVLLAAKPR